GQFTEPCSIRQFQLNLICLPMLTRSEKQALASMPLHPARIIRESPKRARSFPICATARE
ncbi:MAG: hypothetical protein OXC66_15125, partial [Roseovarius sp.]|nr:hypothetical protein [Roseovarius sp.]